MFAGLLGRLATSAADRVSAPRISVLMFHRVLSEPDPLFPGETCAVRFDRLAGALAGAFHVLSLGQAHSLWQRQQLPRRALIALAAA